VSDAERIAELEQEVADLKQRLAEALELVQRLLQRVAELEAQLKQDSHNSNWPSSRDKGRRKRKSLRPKSDKRAGGQPGHSGQTLKLVAEPEHQEVHRPLICKGCGNSLSADAPAQVGAARRQVFDVPPIHLEVTEHRIATVTCPHCHTATSGRFPEAVSHSVQYGPHIKAFSVYLNQHQIVPVQRLSALLGEWLQAPVSTGTIVCWVQAAGQVVQPQVERIQAGLRQAPVVHCDETGQYITGKRFWMHVTATRDLTLYRPHTKRGRAGTDALGVLPAYQGVAVHDGFPSYKQYACKHALCNVHHLRELTAVHEQGEQEWANAFKTLLCELKDEVAQAQAAGLTALPPLRRQAIATHYQQLIDQAYAANPPPEAGWPAGKRGRKRKPKARNLAERLDTERTEVLAFVDDFAVPFDNNLVERDIRMLKVQQKVSGCFRSWAGAHAAAALRSYLSTMVKQGHTVSSVLQSLFSADLIPVALAE
jgi:transposase